MARASTPTLLSLDRFAKILAVSPVHFNGGKGSNVWLDNGSCDDVWPQHAWQNDTEIASREEVAYAIASAERDIAQVLGYWPAPMWIEGDVQPWNAYSGGRVEAAWGKMIAPGKRGATEIEDGATVTYSDPDGDGFDELATITVTTTVTDRREIKVFFADHGGEASWEVRTPRDVVIAGGSANITLDSWLLLKPSLWEKYPSTDGFTPIDIDDSASFVTEVDVWRIYNDVSQAGSQFQYYPTRLDYGYYSCTSCNGNGCDLCGVTNQEGCFQVLDARRSILRPYPAAYSDGVWALNSYATGYPHQVSLNYYAGELDQEYLRNRSLDPLSHYFAEAITWLAVARLPKGLCGCGRVRQRADELQRDASRFRDAPEGAIYTRFKEMSIFNNPFGTRIGEVRAWERVQTLVNDQIWSASVL